MKARFKTKNGIINAFIGYFDVSVMDDTGKEISRHEIMENLNTKSKYFVYDEEEIDLFSFEYPLSMNSLKRSNSISAMLQKMQIMLNTLPTMSLQLHSSKNLKRLR